MAAPEGNQFWRIRSKHGRDRLFETPALLWDVACEYFEWCDNNPLIEVDYRGKNTERVDLPKMRVYTLQGLCLYMGASYSFWREFRSNCRESIKDNDKDFLSVITRIEEVIYTQKFTGAASGFFNPTVIARDLGLKEQHDIESNNKHSFPINYNNLKDDTLRDIANNIANRSEGGTES